MSRPGQELSIRLSHAEALCLSGFSLAAGRLAATVQPSDIHDGWMHFEDKENPVAVELELSTKGTERLEKIARDYAWDLDIKEVWCFVEPGLVRHHLKRIAESYDSVRIFSVPADLTAGLPQEMGFA